MTQMCVETVSDSFVRNDTDTSKRQQPTSLLITLDVVGIVYQTGKINLVLNFAIITYEIWKANRAMLSADYLPYFCHCTEAHTVCASGKLIEIVGDTTEGCEPSSIPLQSEPYGLLHP